MTRSAGTYFVVAVGALAICSIPGRTVFDQEPQCKDTYSFSVNDSKDPCRFSLFSDQRGVIYEGYPTR